MSNIYINFFDKLSTLDPDTINYLDYEIVLTNIFNYDEDALYIYSTYKCNKFPSIETLKNMIMNTNTIDELYIILTDYIKLADYVNY